MRVACRAEESVTGCSGGGPHWPWLEPFPHLDPDHALLLDEIRRDDPFELSPLSHPEDETLPTAPDLLARK
jgi:hypothetical protein